ncbi:uncharacterized protein LOC100899817 [Galendromus occidentalis]|uniref:Uncharacterized protein LOC100899817 n=1 Tax=Galendromus occidentalis TaxID=34638 RepID=A0AAJ6VVK4_9ACAR|nr:uncharacterized protein LOC100899817 [Galendromus occidentalis]
MEKSANGATNNEGAEEDFSSLTCSSMQTEELAAQQKRRQERQARTPSEGYPGLSFGSGFSSNTMMRLRIIANELHNISSVQLKRAEGEMNALGRRIETVDTELKHEEEALKSASDEITEISKVFGPNPSGNDQPGDDRLNEIEGMRSRLELIKAMYGLSS